MQVLDLGSTFLDALRLDQLAEGDSLIHRLDARAKLLVTLAFMFAVVSFGRYEVAALIPFTLFPVALAAIGGVPGSFVFRRLLPVLPFALAIGVLNPVLDRTVLFRIGPLAVSGGWLSLVSILLRVVLTASAAIILTATTGLRELCRGLERLGVPRPFVMQMRLLTRYLFVLAEEAIRLLRARALRSCGRRGAGWRMTGSLLGHLLLRTLGRARRMHLAMQCRGFSGALPPSGASRLTRADLAFVLGWSVVFLLFRFTDLVQRLGAFAVTRS